jgi:hypothetical protein
MIIIIIKSSTWNGMSDTLFVPPRITEEITLTFNGIVAF